MKGTLLRIILLWMIACSISIGQDDSLRVTYEKKFELIHTELHIDFNWENESINGDATLQLRPYFYPQRFVRLDARGFELKSVQQVLSSKNLERVPYTYDGLQLVIDLGKDYTRSEELKIRIIYNASPNRIKNGPKESEYRKGIFFINANNSLRDTTQQIWTQGQTHWNSNWFPTFDSPNVKLTHDFYITVDAKYKTLSNGLLVSQSKVGEKRIDHWRQSIKHAPYLAMLAVGDFAIERDTTANGLELSYYVEPAYKDYAKAIFGRTREMISFFEKRFGMAYPWEKYAQIVVRDFVAGAMENTTASVFNESLQKTSRELIDSNDDSIIAHELAHHWFGNWITCESWGNLPLNEAFANYAEYLWIEHKLGRDEADWVNYVELQAYLNESKEKKKPLIRSSFEVPEEMFDNHSYAKGGRILHALRKYVGDDAFFEALKLYLSGEQTVELADLRKAFEKVTGKDLTSLFEQYFLKPGHPVLEVKHIVEGNQLKVSIEQITDSINHHSIYKLPLSIGIWVDGVCQIRNLELQTKNKDAYFELNGSFQALVFDIENQIVGEIKHQRTVEEALFLVKSDAPISHRYRLLDFLEQHLNDERVEKVFLELQKNSFWKMRQDAIVRLQVSELISNKEKYRNVWEKLARNDPDSKVRQEAIVALTQLKNSKTLPVLEYSLADSSYWVVAAALEGILEIDKVKGDRFLQKLEHETNLSILKVKADYWSKSSDSAYQSLFEKMIIRLSADGIYQIMPMYGVYLLQNTEPVQLKSLPFLEQLARNDRRYLVRYAAVQVLTWLDSIASVKNLLVDIKKNETDSRLLEMYEFL